jgi:hypothetical protein
MSGTETCERCGKAGATVIVYSGGRMSRGAADRVAAEQQAGARPRGRQPGRKQNTVHSNEPYGSQQKTVDHYSPGGLMDHVGDELEEQLCQLDAKWAAGKAASPVTPTNQEDEMSDRKPWDAAGVSRATWYRKQRETAVRQAGETETAETAETETAETVRQPPDAPADLLMAALEVLYRGHTRERQQQAIEDAQKYQAKWGETAQRASWTATQEASLIWQLCGREVKQITSAQAVVGNKVIYRLLCA